MSKTIAAFAWCLLVASSAFGGWVKADKEIRVELNDIIPLPLEADADEVRYVFVGGSAKGFREYDPDPKRILLQILGRSQGTSYLFVSGQKGGKLLTPEVIVIVVGKATPPTPPTPPVDPVDPPSDDVDKLAVMISDAAKTSGWTKKLLADTALAYEVAARTATNATTVEKAFTAAQAVLKSILGEANPIPSKVRSAIATEFVWLPTDGAHEFTAAERERLAKTFVKISEACKRAAK